MWGKTRPSGIKIQREKTSHLFGYHARVLSLASPQIPSTHPLSFHNCSPLFSLTVLLREDASITTT